MNGDQATPRRARLSPGFRAYRRGDAERGEALATACLTRQALIDPALHPVYRGKGHDRGLRNVAKLRSPTIGTLQMTPNWRPNRCLASSSTLPSRNDLANRRPRPRRYPVPSGARTGDIGWAHPGSWARSVSCVNVGPASYGGVRGGVVGDTKKWNLTRELHRSGLDDPSPTLLIPTSCSRYEHDVSREC